MVDKMMIGSYNDNLDVIPHCESSTF